MNETKPSPTFSRSPWTLMRITKLEAIPVRVPLKAGMVTKTAHGDHHTSDYVIVKLHTDRRPGRPG